jgi:hypothetical protein
MPGMPYNLEQGPYLAMLEDLINRDPQRCLRSLRDPEKPLTDILRHPAINIQGGPYQTTAQLADHIDTDWFGIKPDSPEPTGTSRYWSYWRGDAQGIVRETILRAVEVALGLDHDEPLGAGEPRQRWHISLLTACGIRWFEGWISWRRVSNAAEGGHVVIFLLTPTHGKPAEPTLLRPTSSAPGTPGAPYQVNPVRAEGDQGLWAVGALLEQRHDPEPASARWVSPGTFPRPQLGPTYEGRGEVVVVAPSETQGGVLPDGRPYQEAS